MSKYSIVPEPQQSKAVEEETNTIWTGIGNSLNTLNNRLAEIRQTLIDIETQLTPVTPEAQGEVLADQIARLRYLADPEANEFDSDDRQGNGIRTSQPYNDFPTSLLYLLYINQGQMIKDPDVSTEEKQKGLETLSNVIQQMRENLRGLA